MFSLFKLVALAVAATAVLAEPSPDTSLQTLDKRIDTSTHCGQWDSVTEGSYILYLDQWGLSDATSGSACASLISISGTTLAWTTTWSWQGGSSVKSYTNVNLNSGLNKRLSAISSIPATWNWAQSGASSDIIANIAWDLFTSSSSGGSNQYEIMIWLANYNAGPISYTYGSDGKPTPIASNLSLGGQTWNLYYGSNGVNLVYSFLKTSGTATSFSTDINAFLKYLTSSQSLPSTQYLTTVQGGTEATRGSATLRSSSFSVVVN